MSGWRPIYVEPHVAPVVRSPAVNRHPLKRIDPEVLAARSERAQIVLELVRANPKRQVAFIARHLGWTRHHVDTALGELMERQLLVECREVSPTGSLRQPYYIAL